MKRWILCISAALSVLLAGGIGQAKGVYDKIAFTRQVSDTLWDIWMMDTDGSNQTRITNNSSQDLMPYFNPQGTKIVFVRISSGSPPSGDVYIMNADGSNQTNLTNNAQLTGTAMSPTPLPRTQAITSPPSPITASP
jgi:Tol biopolymer transport system component